MAELVTVEPGQVWEDCDKRNPGRQLKVLAIVVRLGRKVAECEILSNGGRPSTFASPENKGKGLVGHKTYIRVSRMKPGSTGYKLVAPAALIDPSPAL